MLDYKIVNYKAYLVKNDENYLDLLSKSFEAGNSLTGQVVMVNKFYVARPDLISLAVYGNDQYADILCKLNGISNPFELNENDLIYCPDIDYMMNACKFSNNASEIIKNNQNIDQEEKDKTFQMKMNSKRSPNQSVEGEQNFIIDKTLGVVFY